MGWVAAGLALPSAIKAKVLPPEGKPLPLLHGERDQPTVCQLCPASCMLQIRVVNGKPVGVSGLSGHPVNQGAICPKGNALLQELYHPDRLRWPLRRTGPRGSNRWERIAWGEALQVVHAKLSDLLHQGKPEALAMMAAPIQDVRHAIQRRFAEAFGTPNYWEWRWALSEPPLDALRVMQGSADGFCYDLLGANLLVSFGWDWLQAFPSPVEAQRAYSELRRERQERRTRMIQIEPRLSITAAKADEWIPIRPATEGVLAVGVARVLIEEQLYDRAFVDRWTTGFEDFERWVFKAGDLAMVSQRTGVPVHRIQQVAREMARVSPSVAITYRGSLFNQAAVHSLNALVGSIGAQRGVWSSETGRSPWPLPPIPALQPRVTPWASLHKVPEILLAGPESPVEVFWMERVNPVFLSPQPEVYRKALARVPFVLSFSSFLDESSQWADLVLPPHTSLEAWQSGFAMTLRGQGVVSVAPPVITPLYETGDHGDFILQLARSLGGRCAQALPWGSGLESLHAIPDGLGDELARLKEQGGWRVDETVTMAVRSALPPHGRRLRFPVEVLTAESLPSPPAAPLVQLSVHVPLAFSFGEGGHLPYLHSVVCAHLGEQWETWLEIHPVTANHLGVQDGQMVWVESTVGKIKARARHYEGIRQDTVSLPFGLGHTAMGRYADGVGSNPVEILERAQDALGHPRWQGMPVRVYAA